MKIYNPKIAEGSEVLNLTVPSGSEFPDNANVGELFFRSDEETLYVYDSTEWKASGGSGTVSNVATGEGLTGGPITETGTISLSAESIASLALADSAVQGPGGGNTQIQFNDSGSLGGDADLTWNKTTNTATVGSAATPGTITAPPHSTNSTAGVSLTVKGGNTTGTNANAGNVTIIGGVATSGAGGGVQITGEDGVGTDKNGGYVGINAGDSTGTGQPGNISLVGGRDDSDNLFGATIVVGAGDDDHGGHISITGGDANLASGGNVNITGGATNVGNGGHVILTGANATGNTGHIGGHIILTAGTGTGTDTPGSIHLLTGGEAFVPRLAIDGSGTFIVGGEAGDVGQVLTSQGSGALPLWTSISSGVVTGALGYTPVDRGGDTMTGLLTLSADPSTGLHAATKQYVDNVAAGLDPKQSCRVATTANITLSGEQTIDDVAVVTGNRVLVKNQGTASQNGIYVVASGAWARAADFDGSPSNEVTSGAYAFVTEGTTQGTSGWVMSTPDPIVVGTTALTFVQFTAGSVYTGGNGITLTGNSFSVDQAFTPTWSGQQVFAGGAASTLAGFNVYSASPSFLFGNSSAGTNAKKWFGNITSGGTFQFGAWSDAADSWYSALAISRTGTTISGMTYGNPTHNPTHTFYGSSIINGEFTVENYTGDVFKVLAKGNAGTNEKRWVITAQPQFGIYATNDDGSGSRFMIQGSRTANAITGITYGNATDNPPHSFYGKATINTTAGGGLIVSDALGYPQLSLTYTAGGTNEKHTNIYYNKDASGGGKWLLMTFLNDAKDTEKAIFAAQRNGIAVNKIVYGNAADNPPHTFYGHAMLTRPSAGFNLGNATSLGCGGITNHTSVASRWYLLCTLPANSAATVDYVHFEIVAGSYSAVNKGKCEYLIGNRDGFVAKWTKRYGVSGTFGMSVECYQSGGAGNEVNVYIYAPSTFSDGAVNVISSVQVANLGLPSETNYVTSTPAGTKIFDSGNETTYPPQEYYWTGSPSSTILTFANSQTSGSTTNITFVNNNTSVRGSISWTDGGTAFNTSSDERLKTNIENASSASDIIDAIQIRQFDWIESDIHVDYGVVAQELEVVYPPAITVGDAETTEKPWQVDYSKLVPILVKEIQELRIRVASLEDMLDSSG